MIKQSARMTRLRICAGANLKSPVRKRPVKRIFGMRQILSICRLPVRIKLIQGHLLAYSKDLHPRCGEVRRCLMGENSHRRSGPKVELKLFQGILIPSIIAQ